MKNYFSFLLICALFISCKREKDPVFDDTYILAIPQGFPSPTIPADNQLTKTRVELGKALFFETRLSIDNSISCASCHLPEQAFSDVSALSVGVEGRIGIRNSPSLANVAWMSLFMKDGGVPSLELQVLAPIADHNEMANSIVAAADAIKNDTYYKNMALRAYNREMDPYVLVRALSAFERTLVSGNSRYDQYLRGTATLTADELHGRDLFFSDSLHCADCHSGPLFSDFSFQCNGLYSHYADTGRARVTLVWSDRGKFKVPSLRNVEYTAPYMFDGSKATLEDVVDHYASGGQGYENQSPLIAGFTLSPQDKADLVAFLKTLTDHEFLNNPAFRP
jgi:cytochrome c peroxidase